MSSLENVFIIRANYQINYISSKNVRELFITLSDYAQNFESDLTTPLLQKSLKIESFTYFGGKLSLTSCLLLSNNPIKKLSLYNVKIEYKLPFSQLLYELNNLKTLKLMGRKSEGIQTLFLRNEDMIKERLDTLAIQIIPEVAQQDYKEINKCKNLKQLTLIYNKPSDLETILDHITDLTQLKTITLRPCLELTDPSIDGIFTLMHENYFIVSSYQIIFERRNINLIQKPIYNEIERTDELADIVMKYRNE